MAWADVETILGETLTAHFGNDITGWVTRLPANDIRPHMPLLVVTRFGGGYDGLAIDEAAVDVDVYASSQEGAKALAGRAVLYLTGLRNHTADGHVLTRVQVMTSPIRRPYDSKQQVHRYGAALRVSVHVKR